MFLKKSPTPRAVRLSDGSVLSLADLPPRQTRWVARRKATVVLAVRHGLLTREEALSRYELSEEELSRWEQMLERHGKAALRVAAIQQINQP